MKVVIPGTVMEQIRVHGEETYPFECCGFMFGRAEDGTRSVAGIRRQSNERADSRENRFLISPAQFKAAEIYARQSGLLMVGIYHSHPDSPARPSEYDRDHAWPWFIYLIVSVGGGQAGEAKAWQLMDDRSGYELLALETAGGTREGGGS
jgi:proteasome lid subunit RPN8/RPN11